MNYHGKMMNIQLPPPSQKKGHDYLNGHRDARHAAAEIANEADTVITELLEALEFALQQTGCDGDLCTEDWHEEARKAIAKAKGETT